MHPLSILQQTKPFEPREGQKALVLLSLPKKGLIIYWF
jgi:hypothetical protein